MSPDEFELFHHQNYHIFRREPQPKASFASEILGGWIFLEKDC